MLSTALEILNRLAVMLPLLTVGVSSLADEKKLGFETSHEVVLKQLSQGLYHVKVDLGELPIGMKGNVHIDLINNFDLDFPVKDLKASCGCTSVSFDKDTIAAGATVRLELALNTQMIRRNAEQAFQIRLVSGRGDRHDITLAVRYRLAGMVAFGKEMVSQEINADVKRQQLAVPFFLTPPTLPKQVSFEMSPSNDGVSAKLAPADSGWQVIIDVEPLFLPRKGFFTTLNAMNDAGETVDHMSLVFYQAKDIELSPRTLIFRGNDEKIGADGILHLHDEKDRPANDRPPSVSAKLGELKLAVKCTRIGKGIYRLHVNCDREKLAVPAEVADAGTEVSWHIVTASRVVGLSSRVHFSCIANLPTP
ncbi:DUF1573 domain-containing protein [Roseiconus lacunae]|uniref:DUF1573 domain-containing protein n=1 Tax=Roseiconus lacunae TaxID=2605694 RepID=A0ABT7PKQ1_9BACT|nr:DUF1573 domain-containing protein [Roseiconus lacunae]MDM4017045.1 DUF1573 domain-containing protein [Roseiconus lacunae]